MTIKLEHYLQTLVQRAAMDRQSVSAGANPEQRRETLKAAFGRLLGHYPVNEPQHLEPRLLERTPCNGYVRERVEIATVDGLRMAMYVLLPQSPAAEPAPAVIACHGHGYGSREIVGLDPDGSERSGTPGLHKDFALALVREGYVVAAPELIGFGDRRLDEDKAADSAVKNSCFMLAAHLLLTGRTLAGLRVYETSRAIDYLQQRADVDSNNIAIMGISGGGLVAGFTAAMDDRIRCAVVSGYASLFADSILTRNHCLDNYIPGVLLEAEMPELLGLIAPRGLFLESGAADHLFPREPARQAYAELRGIYSAAGVPDAVQAVFFDGGHEIHGTAAYAWLRKQLLEHSTIAGGDRNDDGTTTTG
ncbi:Dienelactone hydrolase [Paenibacillus algorifonticola]|uniref:Dienelactone hydrolase n=1 Tax=Paenibacillus algorifonticola TaxID=684063 RepID=A0A1I2GJL6_9BACL|nr:alpha/beta hydrolase family protein [Paenibacillus algorifonticola]SFF17037.1 Dienelactone hydrolase [Paenibacillus algorifonticola]